MSGITDLGIIQYISVNSESLFTTLKSCTAFHVIVSIVNSVVRTLIIFFQGHLLYGSLYFIASTVCIYLLILMGAIREVITSKGKFSS